MSGRDSETPAVQASQYLYFFPDQEITEERLRSTLKSGSHEERAWAVSHLLRYAQWEDIWEYISRQEVGDIFPSLDLPANLQHAWARMLKVEAPVA